MSGKPVEPEALIPPKYERGIRRLVRGTIYAYFGSLGVWLYCLTMCFFIALGVFIGIWLARNGYVDNEIAELQKEVNNIPIVNTTCTCNQTALQQEIDNIDEILGQCNITGTECSTQGPPGPQVH